jgi:hypothetical protein
MRLGDASEHMNIDIIPTGSLALDAALGVGGLPRGRIVERLEKDEALTNEIEHRLRAGIFGEDLPDAGELTETADQAI